MWSHVEGKGQSLKRGVDLRPPGGANVGAGDVAAWARACGLALRGLPALVVESRGMERRAGPV